MANYFLVILNQAGHQWLLGLPEDSFDSWEELRQAFIDNFIATCKQPGNKYNFERIRDHRNEPLRDCIRCFSDMRLKISKIPHDEAILAFIKGLRFHEALRSKLLCKRPTQSLNSSPRPKITPMLMTQKSSSEKISEGPSSLPDGTTAVDVSTTETLGAVTTATT